jgi:hypothetical protein
MQTAIKFSFRNEAHSRAESHDMSIDLTEHSNSRMDDYSVTPMGDVRRVGRLPTGPRPHEDIRRHEQAGLQRMMEKSRGMPPPVDEVGVILFVCLSILNTATKS